MALPLHDSDSDSESSSSLTPVAMSEVFADSEVCACCNVERTVKKRDFIRRYECTFSELEDASATGCVICDVSRQAIHVWEDGREIAAQTMVRVARSPGISWSIQLPHEMLKVFTIEGQHHNLCGHGGPQKLPKRILEIDKHRVYLRENRPGEARYACLSHCWGPKGVTLKRLRDSFRLFTTEGLTRNDLPRNFRDAADFCWRLGLRFLWIDALCIIQCDEDDWFEAAPTMADIYENAYITLGATKAADCSNGLYSKPDPRCKEILPHSGLFVMPLSHPYSNGNTLEYFPLLTRGWVFQERVISRRSVHFGPFCVFWQCKVETLTRDGLVPGFYPPHNFYGIFCNYQLSLFSSEDSVEHWHRLVERYSMLQLTYPKDRLAAISAIVKRELGTTRYGDRYVAGLWERSLLQDLYWFVEDEVKPRLVFSGTPSWSWASTQGRLFFDDDCDDLPENLPIKEISYKPDGPMHMGKIKCARLQIQGPIVSGKIDYGYEDESFDGLNNVVGITELEPDITKIPSWNGAKAIITPDFNFKLGTTALHDGAMISILILGLRSGGLWIIGLALRKTSDTEHERVGFGKFYLGKKFTLTRFRECVAALPVETVTFL